MAELVIGASLLGLGFLCNKNKKKEILIKRCL